MALIFFPGQLASRAEFYHQLKSLTVAGIALMPALEMLHERPPARSFRKPLRAILDELEQGTPFAEAAARVKGWLPEFDVALIHGAERSGRLDQAFGLLSDYYGIKTTQARQFVAQMIYPIFLLHFAIFITYIPGWILGHISTTHFLFGFLSTVVPAWCLMGLIIFAMQSEHARWWRYMLELATRRIPMLGPGKRAMALSRLAAALEGLYAAGLSVWPAWRMAGAASGSIMLEKTINSWNEKEDPQATPADRLKRSGVFPSLFCNLYATGELSGQLDDTLKRLRNYYQEEGGRKLGRFWKVLPGIVLLIVMIKVAFDVIAAHVGRVNSLVDSI